MNQKQKSIARVVSALEARTQLGQIMRRATSDKPERFIVDRRGEPKIVIMGFKDFMKTIAPEPEALAALRAHSKRNKTNRLSMRTIDRELVAAREERANAKSARGA